MAALRVLALPGRFLSFPARQLACVTRRAYSVTPYSSHSVEVSVRGGFPVLSLPLPSRSETCDFVLRPYLQTVADITASIRNEDLGIETLSFHTLDGHRMAGSTPLGLLMQSEFDLKINNINFRVKPSTDVQAPSDNLAVFEELKGEVSRLYHKHNVSQHQLEREVELREQLERVRAELVPLERKCLDIEKKSNGHREIMTWAGLSWMSVQFGFLSYLVFLEYDWDIMEPVTYFVGYGTSILLFSYYILTRQEYAEEAGHERYYLNYFYRKSHRDCFDVQRYNQLKGAVAEIRRKMDRLHDPMLLNLPSPSPNSAHQQ